MRRGRDCSGFTLLEVVVASGIFAIVVAMTMGLLSRAMSSADMDIIQTYVENQVQDAVDDVVKDLKETSPSLRTSYNFTENGWTQTVMCFPTARKKVTLGDPTSGTFIYKNTSGKVQSIPVWQGMEVICYAPIAGRTEGTLFKYVDYTARTYITPITVTSVSSTQIRLSDGTIFNRTGTVGANQKRTPIQGRFLQVMTQGTNPIQLTIRSAVRHQTAQLVESNVITTLTNEALSRNHN